jgi:hypothetical protein
MEAEFCGGVVGDGGDGERESSRQKALFCKGTFTCGQANSHEHRQGSRQQLAAAAVRDCNTRMGFREHRIVLIDM